MLSLLVGTRRGPRWARRGGMPMSVRSASGTSAVSDGRKSGSAVATAAVLSTSLVASRARLLSLRGVSPAAIHEGHTDYRTCEAWQRDPGCLDCEYRRSRRSGDAQSPQQQFLHPSRAALGGASEKGGERGEPQRTQCRKNLAARRAEPSRHKHLRPTSPQGPTSACGHSYRRPARSQWSFGTSARGVHDGFGWGVIAGELWLRTETDQWCWRGSAPPSCLQPS